MAQANKDSIQDKPDQVESDLTQHEKKIQHFHEFRLNGKHENQVYVGSEVDLYKHFNNCEKNPGHANFIPYNTFKMEDIPESHRDQDMFDFIKVVADLTVRINVGGVSPHRPECWPKKNGKYPLHGDHVKKNSHTGSGQVNEVIKFENGKGPSRHGKKLERSYDDDACICVECKDSGKPLKDWWEIVKRTASHVVFDEFDAQKISCRLFFDSNAIEASGDILETMKLLEVNVDEDWCLFSYICCDDHMKHRDKLQNLVKQRVDLWSKVCQKHKEKGNKMTFIVSHPHGCSKQISFGYFKEKHPMGEFEDKSGKFDQNQMDRAYLSYDTHTCKGSSGAPVRCPWLGEGYVHSLGPSNELNYNCSGVSLVYRHGSPFLKKGE